MFSVNMHGLFLSKLKNELELLTLFRKMLDESNQNQTKYGINE